MQPYHHEELFVQPTKLITDLSIAEPGHVLTAERRRGCWRIAAYSCQGTEGKLLYADSNSGPLPPVEVPLDLRGWHRVTAGLWGECEGRRYTGSGHRLKLSGDPCFRPHQREVQETTGTRAFETLEEVVLTSADLTGRSLVIGPPGPGSRSAVTAVAYVRCEPLSDTEVRQIEDDRKRTDSRRLIAYNDGLSFMGGGAMQRWEKEHFWEMIEPYRDSDVESLYWGLLGDVTTFETQVGTMATGPGAEDIESLHSRGINPLVTALEYAHDIGLKFYIYQRMGAWEDPFPVDIWKSEFTKSHPEFRCLSKDGVPNPRLSYAFDEVRQYQVDLLSEVAGYGVDGVDMNFMRGPVYVFYEEPLVKGFIKEFGDDPRTLDEWDERWLKYRRWPLTAFVRELRARLDSVGKRLGKRIALSAVTFATPLANLYYGLDVETWVKEGLVDRLVPWGNVRGMPPVDLAYYRTITRDTATTFWPHLFRFTDSTIAVPGSDYMQEALEYYDAGARGLALWDLCAFDSMNLTGPQLRYLGHIDEVRNHVRAGRQDTPVLKQLDSIGGVDLTVRSAPVTHRERIMPDPYGKHMFMWPS